MSTVKQQGLTCCSRVSSRSHGLSIPAGHGIASRSTDGAGLLGSGQSNPTAAS